MNEPQTWTMIIGTLAAFFTITALVTSWFTRLINARFDAVDARFEGIDKRFEGIDKQFDSLRTEMNVKFEAVDTKLTHLDRDVQALTKQVFHRPE
ncbi:hypothetical protein [Aeromicrobium sp. CTD01-1L150]|uniref:hypothetical protein n=1 Tax=Aeromicrobium sp. CTD01-1L150 TaxID=3341830 RepID=UPI0035C021B7